MAIDVPAVRASLLDLVDATAQRHGYLRWKQACWRREGEGEEVFVGLWVRGMSRNRLTLHWFVDEPAVSAVLNGPPADLWWWVPGTISGEFRGVWGLADKSAWVDVEALEESSVADAHVRVEQSVDRAARFMATATARRNITRLIERAADPLDLKGPTIDSPAGPDLLAITLALIQARGGNTAGDNALQAMTLPDGSPARETLGRARATARQWLQAGN